MNPLVQISEVSVKVCFVGRPRQSIHPGGGIGFEREDRHPQAVDADVVEECSEPLLLPLPCGLPYTLQRLCHALPSLCPVRALLARVPLGPCPSPHRLRGGLLRFVRRVHRCRVGGGALDCSRADLRPPHKLDVQFSRIQLSRRRYPLIGDGRDQRDKINKPELAVELAEWQRCPATAAPLAEPMRPNSPHQPAVELVEELSDVSPLVVVAPTTHDGADLFYQFLGAHRRVAPREPAYLIPEVTDRFLPGKRI